MIVLEIQSINCKGKYISLYLIMDDWTIFQYSSQKCFEKQKYNLKIFLRVVSLHETKFTAKYKIVWLSAELHQQDYKGNHILVFMDMDDLTIFQDFILRFIWRTIHSLMICWRVVLFCDTITRIEYKIFWSSLQFTSRICTKKYVL